MKNNASKAAVVLAEYVVLFNKARTAACPRCCVASWRPLAGGCVLPPSHALALSPLQKNDAHQRELDIMADMSKKCASSAAPARRVEATEPKRWQRERW